LLALATAGALAHVAVRLKGIEVAYALGRERRINTELEEQRRRLHIEIGMLKDPVRVVALARDKLSMGPPAPGDIVRLRAGAPLLPARPVADAKGSAAPAHGRPATPKTTGAKRPASAPGTPGAKPAATKPTASKPSASSPPPPTGGPAP
jgi:hypothetical protein